MRDFLKKTRRLVSVGWFWPLVLLALPNCAVPFYGLPPDYPFNPGSEPTNAVMCDIPTYPPDGVFQCATPAEVQSLMAQKSTHAAIAFNEGEGNTTLTLDYSQAAYDLCGYGNPRKVEMFNDFPKGTQVCLNCGQMLPFYKDTKGVCVAKCKELVNVISRLQDPKLEAFCQANARPSTNFNATSGNTCYEGICDTNANPKPFNDARRNPEDVEWTDIDKANTKADKGTLTFMLPGNAPAFTGGAASTQLITTGDAWVEFQAGEPGVTHVLGLRTSCPDISQCSDVDYGLSDIEIGVSLNFNGEVNIVDKNGNLVAGPFSPYSQIERFRIHVVDRHDGKADLSFSRGSESCIAGTQCVDTPIQGVPPISLSYPMRVDATFREAPASLLNVKIMRIISEKP